MFYILSLLHVFLCRHRGSLHLKDKETYSVQSVHHKMLSGSCSKNFFCVWIGSALEEDKTKRRKKLFFVVFAS